MTAGGAAGGGALPALSLRRLQIDPDTGIPSPTAAESTTRRNPRNVVTVRARRVLVVPLALWTCMLLGDLVKGVSVRYRDKRLDDSEEEVDTEAAVGAATEAEGTRPRSSRPSISERIRERRAVEWAKAMRRVETGHAHKFWVKQAAEVKERQEKEERAKRLAQIKKMERYDSNERYRERLAILKEQDERLESLLSAARERGEHIDGWENLPLAEVRRIDEELRGVPTWHNGRCDGCTGDEMTGCCPERVRVGNIRTWQTSLPSVTVENLKLMQVGRKRWRDDLNTAMHRQPHVGGILDERGHIVDTRSEPGLEKLKKLRNAVATGASTTEAWVGVVEATARQAIDEQHGHEDDGDDKQLDRRRRLR
ncbi:hypothetical protein RI054_05g27900 [Pseudoscourfieldia marina]